jgi:hypothetical protein
MVNACRVLVAKPEEPLGKPRCRWKDNIKMDLREIRWGGIGWINVESSCEYSNETSDATKCWGVLE